MNERGHTGAGPRKPVEGSDALREHFPRSFQTWKLPRKLQNAWGLRAASIIEVRQVPSGLQLPKLIPSASSQPSYLDSLLRAVHITKAYQGIAGAQLMLTHTSRTYQHQTVTSATLMARKATQKGDPEVARRAGAALRKQPDSR